MPENSRGFATFAEEPSGGGEEREPYRGPFNDESVALDAHWRAFGKIATGVAVVTFPLFFLILNYGFGMGAIASVITAAIAVSAFRGFVDVVTRRFIPSPSLFGDDGTNRDRDIVDRRRTAFWRFWYKVLRVVAAIYVVWVLAILLTQAFSHTTDFAEALSTPWGVFADALNTPDFVQNAAIGLIYIVALFAANTIIFLGPLAYVGIRQVKTFEPGDVDWGVQLEDVRGQKSAKEAIRRLVTLWQSGEDFEKAGGKRERGVLFIGPPGTGKTMLAKSLASRFNAPIVLAPGPAFSQSFIGVDVMMVMWVAWRARRLARKWGGQCMVFIDEIDAISNRRSGVLDGGAARESIHDVAFHGPMGALSTSGDLILETPEWRDRLFTARARASQIVPRHGALHRGLENAREFVFPGLGGSMPSGGLQQLLIEMDGVRAPSGVRRLLVNRINTLLDASFVVPARIGQLSLRLAPAKPRKEDLFFIGACNVPREELDPALTRAGRMGYVVLFRTPDMRDREDILDLYVNRIAHEENVASPERMKDLARITMGYSPAMIEQAMSLALTRAHFDHRIRASWDDIVKALTIVAWGDDRELDYTPEEERSLAIHEAGHAVAGHVYMSEHRSSRLSIRPRGMSYGHHAMVQEEIRYLGFTHHRFADLVWSLGAMAAEQIFYGENSVGVGGDLDVATASAAQMVGVYGMRDALPDLAPFTKNSASTEAAERRLRKRFQDVGSKLMNRSHTPNPFSGRSLGAVLEDERKRDEAAVFLGHAFMRAYWLILHNKAATERVADAVLEQKELYGDQVVDLLDSLNITIPDIDPTDESNWPRI